MRYKPSPQLPFASILISRHLPALNTDVTMQSASSADNTKTSANGATTDIKQHSDDRQGKLASQQAAEKEWLERYQAVVEKLSETLSRQRLLLAASRLSRGHAVPGFQRVLHAAHEQKQQQHFLEEHQGYPGRRAILS